MVWGEAASINAIAISKRQSAQRIEPLRPDFRHRHWAGCLPIAHHSDAPTKKPSCDGFFAFAGSAPVSNGAFLLMQNAGCLPERSGGRGQGLDLGREAALVASGLVLVEDLLVGHDVDDALGFGEGFGRLG